MGTTHQVIMSIFSAGPTALRSEKMGKWQRKAVRVRTSTPHRAIHGSRNIQASDLQKGWVKRRYSMRFIRDLVHIAPITLITLASAVGIGACSSQGSDAQSEPQPSGEGLVQSLTRDTDCNVGAPGVLYSATWSGGANGTLNLGNGETATIFNSDGVYFDWSATTPIAVVIIYGDAQKATVHSYDPAATSGEGLSPPKDPNNQEMQLPLYAIKFCFSAASVTTDAGADSSTGTDAGTVTDAGGGAQHDAAPKPPLPNYTW
jgi:hypothetical protein